MKRFSAALLATFTSSAPLRAELADDADAIAAAWAPAAHVERLAPRFAVAGEPLVIALPPDATDSRRDGCTTVAVLGAVSTTFAALLADFDHGKLQAESFLPSVAGAVHVVRCGAERAHLDTIGIQMRSPHAVLETVVATSVRPLVDLRAVLGHRDPGAVLSLPGPGPAPPPGPIEGRARAVERAFARDGATEITPRLAPTDATGSGQILLDLAPGCHRIAVLSTSRGRGDVAPDVDAELAWANGRVAAEDRTDSPDAALLACTGEHRLGVLAYGGSVPREPVMILQSRTELPEGLSRSVGPDGLGRMARVVAEYHVGLPATQPVYSSLGVAGITELPVEVEPGQCYVAIVSAIQSETRLLSLDVETGATKTRAHTDDPDDAVLVSFCAGAVERARFDVEAHGKDVVWVFALWPTARLRLGEETP